MTQQIDVPGMGIVEFPDGMNDADISAAIKKNMPNSAGQDVSGVGYVPPDATTFRIAGQGIPIAGGFIPDTEESSKFKETNPVASNLIKGAGSAVAMAPLMAAAPEVFGIRAGWPLIKNTLAGMGSGGVLGGADAAARGEPISSGIATGIVFGGAAPVGGKVLGMGFQKILDLVGPKASGALKGVNPQALEQAANAAKQSGLTDQQVADMLKTKGAEAFLFEFSPHMTGQAAGVAGMPTIGPGKEKLVKAVEDRIAPEAQHQRLETGLDKLFGRKPVNMTQAKIEGRADRAVLADPLFEQFNEMKVQPTPQIKEMAEQFKKIGLFQDAERIALEEQAAGKPITAMENFFTSGERKDWPTTKSWQHVKEAIDRRIRAAYKNGDPSGEAVRYQNIKERLDDVIGKHPNKETAKVWNDAREAWSTPTGIINAREKGATVWADNYNKNQLIQDLTNYTKAERDAFKEGAQAALAQRLGRTTTGDKTTRNFLQAPNQAEKLRYLTENKNTNTQDFIRSLGHEKGYEQSAKDIDETSKGLAFAQAQKDITADPSKTLMSRFMERFHYNPLEVTPIRALPILPGLKEGSTRRQEKQFQVMRDALADLYAKQGPEAVEIAKALLKYAPLKGNQAGLTSAAMAQALAKPSEPRIPVPFLPPQYGGTQ